MACFRGYLSKYMRFYYGTCYACATSRSLACKIAFQRLNHQSLNHQDLHRPPFGDCLDLDLMVQIIRKVNGIARRGLLLVFVGGDLLVRIFRTPLTLAAICGFSKSSH
jgi:hypothetical protein